MPARSDTVAAAVPDALVLSSLDNLLAALRPQRSGEDTFTVPSEGARLADRIYGGQLLAQAVVASSATVTDKQAHSLHASFLTVGDPTQPVTITVDRLRDGRSMATRQVTLSQGGRNLLCATVSFAAATSLGNPPDRATPMPDLPPPDELPLLQTWAERLPEPWRAAGRGWIERPLPLEVRLAEPPTFLGAGPGTGLRSHWMRLPPGSGEHVGTDAAMQTALLAYASDFFLMDMVFRMHPDGAGPGRYSGFSLDHAFWLHRPPRFDRWHVHVQEGLAVVGERGLARGAIYDIDGALVASVAQEVLVRPVTSS